nr:hypothetical protein [Tanacetum cinerariifolium]
MDITVVTLVGEQMSPWKGNLPRLPIESNIVLLENYGLLHFASGIFLFTYLGLSIGSNINLVSSWQFLIDRFHTKLSSWKANPLSIGGHLTLIKAVLRSLGIYFLSIFKGPKTVLKYLERYPAKFFEVILKILGNSHGSNGLTPIPYLIKEVKVIKSFHGYECGLDTEGCKFNVLWILLWRKIRAFGYGYRWHFSVGDTRRLIDAKILPTLEIWGLIRSWCDFALPTFTLYGHWMSWFTSWQVPKQKSHRLYIIVVASFWWIWRGRMSCSWVNWLKTPLLIAR